MELFVLTQISSEQRRTRQERGRAASTPTRVAPSQSNAYSLEEPCRLSCSAFQAFFEREQPVAPVFLRGMPSSLIFARSANLDWNGMEPSTRTEWNIIDVFVFYIECTTNNGRRKGDTSVI